MTVASGHAAKIGLIAGEALTNAVKHGIGIGLMQMLADGLGGLVRVSSGDTTTGTLELPWSRISA